MTLSLAACWVTHCASMWRLPWSLLARGSCRPPGCAATLVLNVSSAAANRLSTPASTNTKTSGSLCYNAVLLPSHRGTAGGWAARSAGAWQTLGQRTTQNGSLPLWRQCTSASLRAPTIAGSLWEMRGSYLLCAAPMCPAA